MDQRVPDQMSELPAAGRKDDQQKLDWTLLPWEALEPVVRVLMFGEQKYERENWRLVPNSTFRYTKAIFRHMVSYAQGEQNDPESGESHLAHAVCCALFLLGKRTQP